MWTILGLLAGGILIGYFFSNRKYFNNTSEKITGYIIYILLFLMGITVGLNKEITEKFSQIGLQSFLLTLFAVAGSVSLSALVYHLFFKNAK
jgi:uncharacterized membrane protein YbjE (DUF340 family)